MLHGWWIGQTRAPGTPDNLVQTAHQQARGSSHSNQVQRVEVVNGRDLARGVSDAQGRSMSRPAPGVTGTDNQISPPSPGNVG